MARFHSIWRASRVTKEVHLLSFLSLTRQCGGIWLPSLIASRPWRAELLTGKWPQTPGKHGTCLPPPPFFHPPRWHLSKRPEAGLSIHAILEHSSPTRGLVVPSPSAPIPVDRQLLLLQAATTSELLELHIRHEWVRRSSGRDRRRPHGPHKHSTAQPAQQKERVEEHTGTRGGKLGGGCSSSLAGGLCPAACQPPRCGRQSWSLGNLALEGGSQQQSQASGQSRLSNSNQQHNKQATSRQSVAPSSSNNGTRNRPDQHLRPAPLHPTPLQPPRFSHACD